MNKTNFYLLILTILLVSFISFSTSLTVEKNSFIERSKEISDDKCQICELIVKDVIEGLTANNTVAELKRKLNEMCIRIPFHYRACKEFVDSNLDKIVAFIEDNESPAQICEKCGVCSSSESNYNDRYFPQHIEAKKRNQKLKFNQIKQN